MVEKLTDSCTNSWKFLDKDFFFEQLLDKDYGSVFDLKNECHKVAEKVTNNFKKSWKCLDKHYGSGIQLEG